MSAGSAYSIGEDLGWDYVVVVVTPPSGITLGICSSLTLMPRKYGRRPQHSMLLPDGYEQIVVNGHGENPADSKCVHPHPRSERGDDCQEKTNHC